MQVDQFREVAMENGYRGCKCDWYLCKCEGGCMCVCLCLYAIEEIKIHDIDLIKKTRV